MHTASYYVIYADFVDMSHLSTVELLLDFVFRNVTMSSHCSFMIAWVAKLLAFC